MVGVGSPNSVEVLDSIGLLATARALVVSLLGPYRVMAWRGVDRGLHHVAVAVFQLSGSRRLEPKRRRCFDLISCSRLIESCCMNGVESPNIVDLLDSIEPLLIPSLIPTWRGVGHGLNHCRRTLPFTRSALGAQTALTFLIRWAVPDPRLNHDLVWCLPRSPLRCRYSLSFSSSRCRRPARRRFY